MQVELDVGARTQHLARQEVHDQVDDVDRDDVVDPGQGPAEQVATEHVADDQHHHRQDHRGRNPRQQPVDGEQDPLKDAEHFGLPRLPPAPQQRPRSEP